MSKVIFIHILLIVQFIFECFQLEFFHVAPFLRKWAEGIIQPLRSVKMVAWVYCRVPSVKWLLSCSRGATCACWIFTACICKPLLNVKCRLRGQFAETHPAATGEETIFRIQMASSAPGLNVSEVSTFLFIYFFFKAEVRPAVCGKTHYDYCINSLKRLKFIGCPVVV